MPQIPIPDPIDFLVRRKFPEFRKQAEAIARKYGSNNGIVYDHDEETPQPPSEATIKMAEVYRQKLAALSKTEVKKLYQEELDRQYLEDDQRRFFNQSNAEADFNYWSKMPEWNLEEAVALSFGKNPEIVTWPRIEKILSYTSPFVQKFLKLKTLAMRAKNSNHFTDATIPMPSDPIRPYKFVNWMIANNLDFPKELAEKVLHVYEVNKPPKTAYDRMMERLDKGFLAHPKDLAPLKIQAALQQQSTKSNGFAAKPKSSHTKEKETLMKLVIGMAVKGYAYNPSANRTSTASEIKQDLDAVGIQLDEDTIRRKLKEAAELLPQTPEKTKN